MALVGTTVQASRDLDEFLFTEQGEVGAFGMYWHTSRSYVAGGLRGPQKWALTPDATAGPLDPSDDEIVSVA